MLPRGLRGEKLNGLVEVMDTKMENFTKAASAEPKKVHEEHKTYKKKDYGSLASPDSLPSVLSTTSTTGSLGLTSMTTVESGSLDSL